MIHKLGKLKDVESLSTIAPNIRSLVHEKVKLLSAEYGEERDIDNDDGGYVLYCPYGTSEDELKEYFDYTTLLPEYVEVSNGICHALYLTNNEFSVSVIMHEEDLPEEIKKEI
jgi:hypothetical protein